MTRRDDTQARLYASLGRTMGAWCPPVDPEADDPARNRRRWVRNNWPELATALDELVLSATADTAAQIEDAVLRYTTPNLEIVEAVRAADVAVICRGSGRATSEPLLIPAQVICPECGRKVRARRNAITNSWTIASHRFTDPRETN